MDELVKSLRICADGEHCDQCAKWDIKQNGGINACEYAICTEAADAIEQLTADLERSKEYEAFWEKEANEALKKFQMAIANSTKRRNEHGRLYQHGDARSRNRAVPKRSQPL